MSHKQPAPPPLAKPNAALTPHLKGDEKAPGTAPEKQAAKPPASAAADEYAGQGGHYIIKNGKRELIGRTARAD